MYIVACVALFFCVGYGAAAPPHKGPWAEDCKSGGIKCPAIPSHQRIHEVCGAKPDHMENVALYDDKCELNCEGSKQVQLWFCTKDSDAFQEAKTSDKREFKTTDELVNGLFLQETEPENKEWIEFFTAMGFDEATVTEAKKHDAYLQFKACEKKSEYVIEFGYSDCSMGTPVKFSKFGESVDASVCGLKPYKFTPTLEGTNTIILDEKHDGFEAKHTFVFDKEGVTATWSAKGKTAVMKYGRDFTVDVTA